MAGKRLPLPIISELSIERKVKQLVKKLSNLKAHKTKQFDNFNSLIDTCQCKILDQCSCSRQNKVPEGKKGFLTNQRTKRLMII